MNKQYQALCNLILETNQALMTLRDHLHAWEEIGKASAEWMVEWAGKQEVLLKQAEEKTNLLKTQLIENFSKTHDFDDALQNLDVLIANPEAQTLKNVWETYQRHLTECLDQNRKASSRVSKTLPFIHHLLHLFLGHEQQVMVYNAKGKVGNKGISKAS